MNDYLGENKLIKYNVKKFWNNNLHKSFIAYDYDKKNVCIIFSKENLKNEKVVCIALRF
mgnify:CR=1 FL=1